MLIHTERGVGFWLTPRWVEQGLRLETARYKSWAPWSSFIASVICELALARSSERPFQ